MTKKKTTVELKDWCLSLLNDTRQLLDGHETTNLHLSGDNIKKIKAIIITVQESSADLTEENSLQFHLLLNTLRWDIIDIQEDVMRTAAIKQQRKFAELINSDPFPDPEIVSMLKRTNERNLEMVSLVIEAGITGPVPVSAEVKELLHTAKLRLAHAKLLLKDDPISLSAALFSIADSVKQYQIDARRQVRMRSAKDISSSY